MGLKRTLADPEHVAALTSQDLSHQAAAIAGARNDLLDRHAVLGQSQDSGVGVLATQVALYWMRSAAVRRSGLIVMVPMAVLI